MADYVLSEAAVRDLAAIADYTIARFGLRQARHYRDALKKVFAILAENPQLGRDYSHVKPGYRRHHHAGHVIYYRSREAGIDIMRILHQRQDPLRNFEP